MELKVASRTPRKKGETNRIRREGNIPAVLYSQGKKGEELVVEGITFKKILNTIEPGTLSSIIFTVDAPGKKCKAILKDIQYNITTYDVIHLDFEELHEETPVILNIPIKCLNVPDCVGVKLGGVLRQLQRYLRVKCLPKNIPSQFEIDVRDLGLGQARKLETLTLPKGVQPVEDLKKVAVIIARR